MPKNASDRSVSWSTSAADIAEVSPNGTVTAKKAGNAIITAKTENGLKASCNVTVNAEIPGTTPVTAAVTANKNTIAGNVIPFGLRLGNVNKLATVSFTFEKDSVLQFAELIGKNGFTPLGIKWNDDNTATVALSYLQGGAGGSVTRTELFNVAEINFKEILQNMSVGIKLIDVSAAGYNEKGEAVYFTTKITSANAVTSVSDKTSCDVNGDGIIDLLDITYCQRYYKSDNTSPDWEKFSHCDIDRNGTIDIQDLIIILQAM